MHMFHLLLLFLPLFLSLSHFLSSSMNSFTFYRYCENPRIKEDL
jgi:hypothetical protein